ncbi:MAG: hypothetical protein GX851_02670 [Clostridiales bacterium]|nr:hypothetical protein [Clostridiales bacterium]
MSDSLYELGIEYKQAADAQSELIASYRTLLAKAKKRGDFYEIKRVNSALAVLYTARNDLLLTSARLIHYYNYSKDNLSPVSNAEQPDTGLRAAV